MNLPKVSCLCVTFNRPEQLGVVIKCYQSQIYQNRELIIIYEDNDPKTKQFLNENTKIKNDTTIKTYEIPTKPKKLSLGALRNISAENATGTFFAQWG